MQRLKVVHIVEDMKIGGLEKVIATLATGLDRNRYDLQVWCISRGGEIADRLRSEGIPVTILGMKNSRDPFFFIGLCRRMRRERIDILHAHGYTATTIGRIAGILAGVRTIFVHLHSTYFQYTRKQLMIERILSRWTAKVICCSSATARFAIDTEGISPSKTTVIYNGIAAIRDCPPAALNGIRRNDTVIGCVASLEQHKGHRYLLEAAKTVLCAIPSAKFLFAGDGSRREELERYAGQLGIAGAVVFAGWANDVAPLLSLMDIVVLPSSGREGLGISLIEAMSLGKPLVGTDLGGIPEVIADGENGRLVRPGDAAALADAITAIARDNTLAQKMGAKGKAIYQARFTAEKMIAGIDTLYREHGMRS